jgi:hypothetical protein
MVSTGTTTGSVAVIAQIRPEFSHDYDRTVSRTSSWGISLPTQAVMSDLSAASSGDRQRQNVPVRRNTRSHHGLGICGAPCRDAGGHLAWVRNRLHWHSAYITAAIAAGLEVRQCLDLPLGADEVGLVGAGAVPLAGPAARDASSGYQGCWSGTSAGADFGGLASYRRQDA